MRVRWWPCLWICPPGSIRASPPPAARQMTNIIHKATRALRQAGCACLSRARTRQLSRVLPIPACGPMASLPALYPADFLRSEQLDSGLHGEA